MLHWYEGQIRRGGRDDAALGDSAQSGARDHAPRRGRVQSACCFLPPHPLAAQIDAYLQELSDAGTFSGAVLVARDGAPILRKGYGMASIEYGVPNTPETRFRISSLTKAFTAMAAGYSTLSARAAYCDPGPLFGMGDLYSTVDDLWRWDQALSGAGPFPGPLLSSMFHAYTYSAPINAAYGYGWYMRRCDGLMHYWHTGSTPGYRSYMLRVPEAGYTLIILGNLETTPLFDMADAITALALAPRSISQPG
ncbi:MAG: beta-lactamase family protein [Chloroflexaceae bacterium]|nr:beta-lactamase family protein [Chloroflexaceae bacterium]